MDRTTTLRRLEGRWGGMMTHAASSAVDRTSVRTKARPPEAATSSLAEHTPPAEQKAPRLPQTLGRPLKPITPDSSARAANPRPPPPSPSVAAEGSGHAARGA
eukprot:364809-Chlamydomonas_euryale.AAC.22